MKTKYSFRSIRKKTLLLSIISFSALTIFYTSCKKFQDDFDFSKIIKPTWNPEFAVPLVNSTLYIADFFEDSSNLNIVTNPDQSLSFIYSSENLISTSAGDLINFPDQEFDFTNNFPLDTILPGIFDTINFVENYQFIPDTSNQRIDSIFLKNGQLTINGKTNLNRDNANIMVTIPDIRNIASGNSLSIIANINNPGGQSPWVYFDTVYNLEEYKILLNHPSDTAQNTLTILMDIIIAGDENPDLSPYEFTLEGSLLSLEFSESYGHFGQYELPFKDSLEISLFEDVVSGGINIGEGSVKLSFDITNSFGAPITFIADTLMVHSSVNSPYYLDIELFGPGIPNIFDIESPGIDQVGETIETFLDFTQANFAEAINLSPQVFYYDFIAITNFVEDTTSQNFILDRSEVTLDVNLEFELFASIASFTIEDTVVMDINENPNEIDHLLFRINLINGFPINAHAQVYFADDDFQIVDSLITSDINILRGAPVSGPPAYRVTEPSNKITDIIIDRPRLDNIVKSKYLFLKTTLSTTDQSLIKIYDDYGIQIKLGAIVGITIESGN